MNWIPKEKNQSKKPTDQQRMKDYFRRHRKEYKPSFLFPDVVDPVPQLVPDGRQSSSNGSLANRHAPATEGNDDREHLLRHPGSFEGSGVRSLFTRHSSEKLEMSPPDLSKMNLRALARTVKRPNQHISTDLVHLEMIKKIFAYQPRNPDTEKSPKLNNEGKKQTGAIVPQYQWNNDDAISDFGSIAESEELPTVIWDNDSPDRSITASDDLPTSSSLKFLEQEERPLETSEWMSELRDEETATDTASSQVFYWDLTNFSHSYGFDNPAFSYQRKS